MPTGLGKIYFCRAEDLEKNPGTPMQPLGEVVKIEPGMLTYKDDESKSEYGAKGFSTTFTGTMEEPGPELLELLNRPTLWDVKLEGRPGRMPRKMKKALHARYRRDTKWKRKAGNYRRRLLVTLRDAEIVITREQRDCLSYMLSVKNGNS